MKSFETILDYNERAIRIDSSRLELNGETTMCYFMQIAS